MKVLDHGHVELIDSMPAMPEVVGDPWGAGDQRIVDAARVSIAGKEVRATSDSEKLLRYLIKNEHWTPVETVRFTFDMKLPIFIARQTIRHRAFSYSEMSARYGVLPSEFYVPALDRMQAQSTNNKQGSGDVLPEGLAQSLQRVIESNSRACYALYTSALDSGLARELARMMLPLNIYTRWWMTCDLRNLMNFLRLRLDAHAQWESQEYARAIVELIRPLVPCTVKIFEESLQVQP